MKRLPLVATLAIALTAAATGAEEARVVSIKRLSMDTALTVAKATVAACRDKGIQIGVTVVDRDGTVQVQLRDTIAPTITNSISLQKAFTAVSFTAPTSQLGARADTPIGRIDGLVMSAGGVPIEVGGTLLGGVGVSGAPSGQTDEECALAGIAAVKEDLELGL